MSDTSISSTAMNNLFDNVNPDEASSGDTEYRAIDVYNSGDASGEVVEMWIDSQTSSGDTIKDDGTGFVWENNLNNTINVTIQMWYW